jgi:SAM-dependent methyltransferase
MASWNELFLSEKHIETPPESEVIRFAKLVSKRFPRRTPRIWDLCCGAGRHTVALARFGFDVYASDNAPNAIERTKDWLAEAKFAATCAVAEMTENPWKGVTFQGILCWNSINHNTAKNIQKTIDMAYDSLEQGGLFLVTLKSSKADRFGVGTEVEPNTFVPADGNEAGVLHHYFNHEEIKCMFRRWRFLVLCEEVIKNYENLDSFWQYTPFRHTTWGALLEKA